MTAWQAARSHPHTYPGTHPDGSFALVDGAVRDLVWEHPPKLSSLRLIDPVPAAGGSSGSLSDLLAERGLPGLEDRFPVLAYGGNRSPATLALKLKHYGYLRTGRGIVLPVLTARMRGIDVVAGGLSGQGYLYADLYADDSTAGTQLNVHVLLLDSDQLRVMNDSEGVRTGLYDAALLGGMTLDGVTGPGSEFSAIAYCGVGPVVISPLTVSPLAFSAVRATGRALPEFTALEMLAHVLEALDLIGEVRAVVGAGLDEPGHGSSPWPSAGVELADSSVLAAELMRYLNGQWWYRQHTGERRLLACERLHALISARLLAASTPTPVRSRLITENRILTADQAYRPGARHTLGATLA